MSVERPGQPQEPTQSSALPQSPHIGVVGVGSIGSLLAAHLTETGHDVSVVDAWYPHVEAVRSSGVEIQTPDEHLHVRLAAYHVDEVDEVRRPWDLVLVAVKAYDSARALRLVEPLLHTDTVVVPVQNGMTDAWFARLAHGRRLLGCSVHVPAELTGPGQVRRYLPRSRRTFSIGEVGGGRSRLAEDVARLFSAAGECEMSEDLMAVKWAKLAVNTMTNAPAALSRWTTRRLWADPQSVPLAARAAGETLAVARAEGVEPAPVYGRYPASLFVDGLHDPAAAAQAQAALAEMAAERVGASESRPSMLQDVDRGRRTEVRYLNGHVTRTGTRHGIATPANEVLTRTVEEIDRGHVQPSPELLDRCNEAVTSSASGTTTLDP